LSPVISFRTKKIIKPLLTAIAFFLVFPVFAQDNKVCVGTKAIYAANGLDGSTYEYQLAQPHSGIINQMYSDTIVVEWGYIKGIFQLGVRETSQYGCEGNWAFLDVEVVGDDVRFTQPSYYFCDNDGVTVEFNRSDFKAWEWVDKTVGEDGYIAKPGRYELRTIDQNNCHLSSFIDVVQIPAPKVSLGSDMMICTPGFTLHAENTEDNPDETVYTWSTGETGAFLRNITVDSHDMNQDHTYWVRAELNGCVSNDTITVLACDIGTSSEITDKYPATLYPNPTDGKFILNFETSGTYSVTIASMSGTILLRQIISGQIIRMDIGNYPAGVYLLTIDDGKQIITMRVVKE